MSPKLLGLNEGLKCILLMLRYMQIISILYLTKSLRIELKSSSLLRFWLSTSLYVVYIWHLLKRLVIISRSLVSVAIEFTIVIIYPLTTEEYPGDIAVLVSSRNRFSISFNGLEYTILRTWCACIYLASQCFVNWNRILSIWFHLVDLMVYLVD